jgi:hypothetical protein
MSFADDYPDECATYNRRTKAGKIPWAEYVRLHAERTAAIAAKPRCRCGLMLPCDDCLPTDAASFARDRMHHEPKLPVR